jgi:hypothetical protein
MVQEDSLKKRKSKTRLANEIERGEIRLCYDDTLQRYRGTQQRYQRVLMPRRGMQLIRYDSEPRCSGILVMEREIELL